MPKKEKMLGAFFGNLIQGIGKKRYQDYLQTEKERLGEKQANQGRADQLINTSLEKALDPDTPYLERIEWMKMYKGHTGVDLPTPSPPGKGVKDVLPQGQPVNETDFLFGTDAAAKEQGYRKGEAEIDRISQGAEANKALAEQRRTPKPTPTGGGPEKLKLDKLKAQFSQLNTQYDDLYRLVPRDAQGNVVANPENPQYKELQRVDSERNKIYNEIYGGEKKTIPGF